MNTPESWHQQGEALVTTHSYGSAEFAPGLELLIKAAAWYRRAAEQGHPVAQDRLADLYMLDRGVPQNDVRAFQWYARTAAQGYAMAQCNLAYMHAQGLGTPADHAAATTLYLQAAAQGEGRAYFNLGLRYAAGWGAPRNLVHASAWMTNAARLDYPTAKTELELMAAQLSATERIQVGELGAIIEANFAALQQTLGRTPSAMTSIETYRQIVDENFAALAVAGFAIEASKRLPQALVASVDASVLHHPDPPTVINAEPRIFTVAEFISKTEVAHLMAPAVLNMHPARESTRDQLSQEQTAFTGHSATFHMSFCDAVIRNLERRIAAAFGLPTEHVEPLSVLRYQRSDRYAPHVDYFDTARLEYNRHIGDKSGQRIAYFLVYLRAPEVGGETHYLKLKLKIAGRSRMAVCHSNLTPAGQTDPMTLHTGEPVIEGEKWLACTTLREQPLS